jgi:hypothetical protein
VLPLSWFHSYQGVKAVVLSSWKWIGRSQRVLPIICSQPAIPLNLKSDEYQFFNSLLEGIDQQLHSVAETFTGDTKKAYENSVAYLKWAHCNPERNRIMGFAASVSRRLVDLLAEKDSRTLVIIACFFAMMRAVDDIWWLQGIAKREVMGFSASFLRSGGRRCNGLLKLQMQMHR